MKILILLLVLPFSVLAADECSSVRAAFDIGSGTTKMKVARVNSCQQRIEKILLEADIPVAYKEDLEKSSDGKFSFEIIQSGISALKNLRQQAIKLGAKEFFAVATSAARAAQNAPELVLQIDREVALKVHIISQQQEAILGHVAALAQAKVGADHLVVWDIGGGSMQITTGGSGDFQIYAGQMASVSFKNHVIEAIQKKKSATPNPISASEYEQALRDVQLVAKFSVPQEIKNKLAHDKTQVIGIGGVHYYSVGGQLGRKQGQSYSVEEISALIPKRLKLNDVELKSPYAATEVTNLILIGGFMQELGISKVELAKINLADGLLLSGSSLL